MLVSQVLNGMLLPFILVFMLLLINKEKLMGPWRNGRWFNGVAWITTVVMIAADRLPGGHRRPRPAGVADPARRYTSSSSRSGSSRHSFTRTRNPTASRPSMIRWS